MEQQTKVINQIKAIGTRGSGKNLGIKKDDECYTHMQDIINELTQWAMLGKFQGKDIICPCDWDITDDETIYSIKIEYKDPGVEVTGNNVYKAVKSVQYDLWQGEGDDTTITTINLAEDEIEDFLRDKLTCNFIRTFTQNARAWGIKSVTASGYNPANNKGTPFQEIDYSKYDLCVTNPPFSLYKTFMKAILGKIDFIILAPFLDRKSTFIGIPLQEGLAFIGFSGDTTAGYIPMNFRNPTAENSYNEKKVACEWITSFPDAQQKRNQRLAGKTSGIVFDLYKDEYVTLPGMIMKDGSTPIKVPCNAIPDDITCWMFSAINVLTKINLDEYEWYITNFTSYYNYEKPEKSPFLTKTTSKIIHQLSDGSNGFCGIVFRRKADTNA